MIKCHESNTTIKKKNKTRHEETKKYKYFYKLVLNIYIVKDIAVDKFKDIITSYYKEHLKEFDFFTVCVYWKVDDITNCKISVPKTLSYGVTVHGYPNIISETACDFSNRLITSYLTHGELSIDRIQETEIVFISNIKDMTVAHHMQQPKSMLCRKMLIE